MHDSATLSRASPTVGMKMPGTLMLCILVWAAFAAAIVAARVLNPGLFDSLVPDSAMRLVQVRDVLAGQNWFDLVQHRLDPPDGILMHWSRLIDAPLAGLVLLGNLFGDGESFALVAWPLLLLLGLIISSAYVAVALAGRGAALPATLLPLVFPQPLLLFLPNQIDHHNAQLVLILATLAAVLRLRVEPRLGLAAGVCCALTLAIGLEMLPYVALIGCVIAAQWAWRGEGRAGAGLFGLAFGLGPAILYLVAGSPAAPIACDALSWAFAIPAAIAGLGLAAAVRFIEGTRAARFIALAVLAVPCAASFALVSPDCLAGPFGMLSEELRTLWLSTVTEAQPFYVFAAREPVTIIAVLGPPVVAFLVALRRALPGKPRSTVWAFPAALLALALALCFYQVRTLPLANALAIPVLAAWIAERRASSQAPAWRTGAVVAAILLALPVFHLGVGWLAVTGVALASGGRLAPVERVEAPANEVAGLSQTQRDCRDAASAALLAAVPQGVVLAPVFLGPSVLTLSEHAVIAGPYHRAGAAILDTIHAMAGTPKAAHDILQRRNIDYLALCPTLREVVRTARDAPQSMTARLLAGESLAWLQPVQATAETPLRLWRVIR